MFATRHRGHRHFDASRIISRQSCVSRDVFFIATRTYCVRFILYHFFTIYSEHRRGRSDFCIYVTYDRRDPPSESCDFRGTSVVSRRARPPSVYVFAYVAQHWGWEYLARTYVRSRDIVHVETRAPGTCDLARMCSDGWRNVSKVE